MTSPIYLCPKNLDTFWCTGWAWTLPDNFQMREHSWPCRFHINVTSFLAAITPRDILVMLCWVNKNMFERTLNFLINYFPYMCSSVMSHRWKFFLEIPKHQENSLRKIGNDKNIQKYLWKSCKLRTSRLVTSHTNVGHLFSMLKHVMWNVCTRRTVHYFHYFHKFRIAYT